MIGDDGAEIRRRRRRAAVEHGRQLGEQPRPAEAAAADDHPVAAGGAQHAERIERLPDVAVAEDGDADVRLQLGDRRPVGVAGVELGGGAGVETDGGRAFGLGDFARVTEGEQVVVDALADLHRHRHPSRAADGGAHDRGHQARLHRDGGAAAVAGDLRHRAAEVQVEVLDALARQHARRLAHLRRVAAVELDGPRPFVGRAVGEEPRARVALEQPARRDHLGDVQPGAELATQAAEGVARDARHRRQHDRRPDGERADVQGLELARRGERLDGGSDHGAPQGRAKRGVGQPCSAAMYCERRAPGSSIASMLALAATASPLVRRYTLEEFFALEPPPGGGHYELIAGVLYMVPPPTGPHHLAASRLVMAFAAYAAAHPERCVLFVPRAPIWTPADTYLEPDLFLVTTEHLETMGAGNLVMADLVVEILSPSSAMYDRTAKADTYAALGVRELWLVDLEKRAIEQRVLADGRWQVRAPVAGDVPLEAAVFPGLVVAPERVFS